MNVRKTVTAAAVGLGALAGSVGLANALSSSGSAEEQAPTAPAAGAEVEETEDPMLDGSIQSPEIEGQSEAAESAALESLATITADEAGQAALTANPGGTVADVELENENGSVVYEVHMTDASGQAIEVQVDAGNGAVLGQEADDDSDAQDEAEGVEDDDDGVEHEN